MQLRRLRLNRKNFHRKARSCTMTDDLLILTHGGEEKEQYLNAVVPPVFLNSLHVYDTFEEYAQITSFSEDRYVYGRNANPTARILETKISRLEHGVRAAAFASGMAATTSAIMATCRAGSHIICLRDVYHPVRRFLEGVCVPTLNMTVTYLTGLDLEEMEAAIRPETALIILESPATFVFTAIDIAAVAVIASQHGIKTFIDNTYCTPLYQKPLELGVDIVMHTLSKYIGGHSDIIGGVLVSKDDELMRKIISQTREWFGGVIGPMEAWLAIRGLRTLSTRLQSHQSTAMAVAAYLEGDPKVKKVNYTGLASHPQAEVIARQQTGHTGLMSFQLDASPEEAVKFINRLRLFGKGCSWGGFESLALTPLYKSTDAELELLQLQDCRGLIRIHCGLEGADNLIADLEQAFNAM